MKPVLFLVEFEEPALYFWKKILHIFRHKAVGLHPLLRCRIATGNSKYSTAQFLDSSGQVLLCAGQLPVGLFQFALSFSLAGNIAKNNNASLDLTL
jgi:hypothetical protein